MPKYCIFCGGKPENKTKEHVIPKWLISLTGKPNRKVNLGMIKSMDENALKQRQYSFDAFTFPACETCNNQYAIMESNAKIVVEKVLQNTKITTNEISLLLDWFDKVRVGLWLGYNQLEKKFVNIDPSFHISTRVGQYDRALFISKSNTNNEKLNFAGADTFSFAFTPSAFVLSINNYYFTNISFHFLFARRIGFPYPKTLKVYPSKEHNDIYEADISEGIGRIMNPLIRFPVGLKCIEIYQPMYPGGLILDTITEYDCQYVRENSLNFKNGIGAIFRKEKGVLKKYLQNELVSLSPAHIYEDEELLYRSAINILKWQNHFNSQQDLSLLSKESKKSRLLILKQTSRINNYFIQVHENKFKKIKKLIPRPTMANTELIGNKSTH